MKYIQRFLVALALGLAVLAGFGAGRAAFADDKDPRQQDMVLGKAEAPVTIIEYASMTCPHCAHFAETVLPDLKKDYIDTGKVKLIFREFPLDQMAYFGSVLTRCSGPQKFFSFVDVLFAQQAAWISNDQQSTINNLKQIGRLGGVSSEQFDKCLADKALGEYILNSRIEANQKFKVNSTPTLIINGDVEPGVPDYSALRKKLDALLK
jgi:protein-disulfide isomerase